MYDTEHMGVIGTQRATVWEGHPITRIEVQSNGQWVDLNNQPIAVEVSIWLVVTLCLIGGAIGGIAAKDTLKGSIWWRIFIGIVGAIVLVWLCVFAVVPLSHSMIAHSLISVFVVGIVGGYAGTRVLDFAAKRFGVLT